MMNIAGLSHLFKWENLHNWWLTKYFFAPLYMFTCSCTTNHLTLFTSQMLDLSIMFLSAHVQYSFEAFVQFV